MTSTIYNQEAYLLLADGTRWPIAGPLSIDSEIERFYVASASMPDERWEQTDAHGHEHRYVRDEEGVPRLPSLERRSVHMECDGSCFDITHGDCDGYNVDEWHCRECDDVVEPGFKPDYEAQQSGIPVSSTQHYTVAVEADPQADFFEGAAYVYMDPSGIEQRHPLPPLIRGNITGEGGPGGWTYTTELHGYETKAIRRKPVGP